MKERPVFSVKDMRDNGGLMFTKDFSAHEFVGELPGSGAWERIFGNDCRAGSGRLRLEFSLGSDRVLMEGRLEGRWTLMCSRCLGPHEAAYETALEETYPLTQETIDPWQEIRQSLILSLPSKSLCSPTCSGLCPRCGQDLNLSPCLCAAPQPGAPAAEWRRTDA